jgi:chemotaxis protein MotB
MHEHVARALHPFAPLAVWAGDRRETMRLMACVPLALTIAACSTTKEATPAATAAIQETQQRLDHCNSGLSEVQHKLSECEQKASIEASGNAYYRRRMNAYRDIADKLHAAFAAAPLKTELRDGLLIVHLPEQILFDLGHFQLTPSGESTLRRMADLLRQFPDREFLIAGYTDDVSVKKDNPVYRDNWELSAFRALSVVRYLDQQGIAPKSIAAAGFGKYHPIADNTSESGRATNRRIEIIFLPTLQELPALPQ